MESPAIDIEELEFLSASNETFFRSLLQWKEDDQYTKRYFIAPNKMSPITYPMSSSRIDQMYKLSKKLLVFLNAYMNAWHAATPLGTTLRELISIPTRFQTLLLTTSHNLPTTTLNAQLLQLYAQHCIDALDNVNCEQATINDKEEGEEIFNDERMGRWGTIRPDFISTAENNLLICELNCRFSLNGYLLSSVLNEITKINSSIAGSAAASMKTLSISHLHSFHADLRNRFFKDSPTTTKNNNNNDQTSGSPLSYRSLFDRYYINIGNIIALDLNREEVQKRDRTHYYHDYDCDILHPSSKVIDINSLSPPIPRKYKVVWVIYGQKEPLKHDVLLLSKFFNMYNDTPSHPAHHHHQSNSSNDGDCDDHQMIRVKYVNYQDITIEDGYLKYQPSIDKQNESNIVNNFTCDIKYEEERIIDRCVVELDQEDLSKLSSSVLLYLLYLSDFGYCLNSLRSVLLFHDKRLLCLLSGYFGSDLMLQILRHHHHHHISHSQSLIFNDDDNDNNMKNIKLEKKYQKIISSLLNHVIPTYLASDYINLYHDVFSNHSPHSNGGGGGGDHNLRRMFEYMERGKLIYKPNLLGKGIGILLSSSYSSLSQFFYALSPKPPTHSHNDDDVDIGGYGSQDQGIIQPFFEVKKEMMPIYELQGREWRYREVRSVGTILLMDNIFYGPGVHRFSTSSIISLSSGGCCFIPSLIYSYLPPSSRFIIPHYLIRHGDGDDDNNSDISCGGDDEDEKEREEIMRAQRNDLRCRMRAEFAKHGVVVISIAPPSLNQFFSPELHNSRMISKDRGGEIGGERVGNDQWSPNALRDVIQLFGAIPVNHLTSNPSKYVWHIKPKCPPRSSSPPSSHSPSSSSKGRKGESTRGEEGQGQPGYLARSETFDEFQIHTDASWELQPPRCIALASIASDRRNGGKFSVIPFRSLIHSFTHSSSPHTSNNHPPPYLHYHHSQHGGIHHGEYQSHISDHHHHHYQRMTSINRLMMRYHVPAEFQPFHPSDAADADANADDVSDSGSGGDNESKLQRGGKEGKGGSRSHSSYILPFRVGEGRYRFRRDMISPIDYNDRSWLYPFGDDNKEESKEEEEEEEEEGEYKRRCEWEVKVMEEIQRIGDGDIENHLNYFPEKYLLIVDNQTMLHFRTKIKDIRRHLLRIRFHLPDYRNPNLDLCLLHHYYELHPSSPPPSSPPSHSLHLPLPSSRGDHILASYFHHRSESSMTDFDLSLNHFPIVRSVPELPSSSLSSSAYWSCSSQSSATPQSSSNNNNRNSNNGKFVKAVVTRQHDNRRQRKLFARSLQTFGGGAIGVKTRCANFFAFQNLQRSGEIIGDLIVDSGGSNFPIGNINEISQSDITALFSSPFYQINCIAGFSSILAILLTYANQKLVDLSNIKVIIFGGECLPLDMRSRFRNVCHPHLQFIGVYGSAETGVYAYQSSYLIAYTYYLLSLTYPLSVDVSFETKEKLLHQLYHSVDDVIHLDLHPLCVDDSSPKIDDQIQKLGINLKIGYLNVSNFIRYPHLVNYRSPDIAAFIYDANRSHVLSPNLFLFLGRDSSHMVPMGYSWVTWQSIDDILRSFSLDSYPSQLHLSLKLKNEHHDDQIANHCLNNEVGENTTPLIFAKLMIHLQNNNDDNNDSDGDKKENLKVAILEKLKRIMNDSFKGDHGWNAEVEFNPNLHDFVRSRNLKLLKFVDYRNL